MVATLIVAIGAACLLNIVFMPPPRRHVSRDIARLSHAERPQHCMPGAIYRFAAWPPPLFV